VHSGVVGRPGQIASIVLLSLAVLLLFSFGSQVVLAPSVVVVGWFLARVSSPYLRMAWMIVAGLLAVEFIYLVSMRLDWPTLLIPASLALVAGIGVGVLFHRTPSTPPGANHTLL